MLVQELDAVSGFGPSRSMTRGSFFGASISAIRLPKLDDALIGGELASDICSDFSSCSVVVLREGDAAGLPLLFFDLRSRSVIDMDGVTGAGVFREGGEATSKVDKISSVR